MVNARARADPSEHLVTHHRRPRCGRPTGRKGRRHVRDSGEVYYSDDEGRFDILETAPNKSALELFKEKQAKKELKGVDHSKIECVGHV